MNVIVFASRKGGSGKSTLAAHIAAHVHKATKPCLLIDADPQGSLTLWHKLRGTNEPAIKTAVNSVSGIEWVFIDTPPNMSAVVEDAIRNATMAIIPARPGVFDVNAVQETILTCRAARKPYAVVINGAPACRDDAESPIVTIAREALIKFRAPVWGGQITNRADLLMALSHGEGAREYYAEGRAAAEIARLWSAIERSVKAIRGSVSATGAMHKQAA
jgi:cellulose biosynthesis protein BcsQ